MAVSALKQNFLFIHGEGTICCWTARLLLEQFGHVHTCADRIQPCTHGKVWQTGCDTIIITNTIRVGEDVSRDIMIRFGFD